MSLLTPPMKKSFSLARLRVSRLSSFTLVELLVVIGIIAILAGVLTSAGLTVLREAQKTKANNMAIQIQTAAYGYYTEYGVYPIVGAPTGLDVYYPATGDITDQKNLAWCLCGNISAYDGSPQNPTATNSRSIAFLSLRKSDVDANGIPLNTLYPTGGATNFNIAIDGNYDGLLGGVSGTPNGVITNFALPTMPQAIISQGIAVWANCNSGSNTNNGWYVHTY
jgi:prepilin-type N-terminal cleavage/methylation domain-containing protein